MVDPQASRFWQASLQSGLMNLAGLQACWETLPPEKRVADQLDRRLARQAVQASLLTLWQAQQLLAGRSTGFKIDRYVLLEMIGQGGMGRVYLAKDTRLNRRVAIKILSPERVNNPRAIARFQREARVGAQLQHEHLVRIYDEGESNGKCYLVMEYIEGKNLGVIIAESGPMPPSTAANLVRQVALGLEHAQQKGLIHRDVNPFNILVTREGMAKLTDLGLAIDLAEEGQVTRDGATVGTFDYVSPEQARHSRAVDTRSDIYSLGCTLYHILAGQVPFPSPSLPEKLFGHQAVEPEALESLAPGVPEKLGDVVRKMMAKQPEQRFASPIEVAQALEPFIDEQAPPYRELPPSSASGPTSRDARTVTRTRIAPSQPPIAMVPISPISSSDESPAPLPSAPALPPELARIAEPKPATPMEDFSVLGLNLNPGPTPSPRPAPSVPSHPKKEVEAAPESSPTVEIPAQIKLPKEPPLSPAIAPAPIGEDLPDFSKIGENARAAEDLSGLALTLDFNSVPPAASSPPANRPETKPKPPQVKEARPAPPAPSVAPPTKPAPTTPEVALAPVARAKPAPVAAPVPEELPDFLKIGGEAPTNQDALGFNLGLNLGSAPSTEPPPKSRPKPSPEPKTKPAPAPVAPAVASAPSAKAKPAAPASSASPSDGFPDLSKIAGETPSPAESLGVNLGLNLGEAPPVSRGSAKTRPKPVEPAKANPAPPPAPPVAPAPAPVAKAKPTIQPPPPSSEPLPDFSKIGGAGSPADDSSGLGLGLNFGPEPLLSGSSAKPKSAPKAPTPPPSIVEPLAVDSPSTSVSAATVKPERQGLDRRLILAGAAVVLLIVVAGGLFASGFFGKAGGSKTTKAKPGTDVAKVAPEVKEARETPEKAVAAVASPATPKAVVPEVPKGQPIAVKTPDGTVIVEPDFKSAMQRAIGSKGHVLLNNTEPIRFSGANAAIRITGGPLYIRAAEGVRPVLEVDMKGAEAFLTTGAQTPISIVGVTMVAHYGSQSKGAAPLIEALGNVRLEHCAFNATGSVVDSRAVVVEGGRFTLNGCWFQGFDTALDIASIGDSASSVSQSMIVRGKAGDQPIGWGLRVRRMGGGSGKNPRTLILDHCTFQGKGLLDLVDFSPQSPYKVVIKHCAVSADTSLMAWEPSTPDTPLDKQTVLWSGVGNQYDIRGKSWVVLSSVEPVRELPDGPTDLSSWSKIGTETEAVPPPVKFQTDPATLSESPRPADFAVQDQGALSLGADPKQVGP